MEMQDFDDLTRQVADLILSSKRIVVFTGAGVSTESGIPDFRSAGGIWSRFDPDDFTYQKFVSDVDARRKHWQLLGEGSLTTDAKPNPAHFAIAELDSMGMLDCVITQNVDNLHQKGGLADEKVFELHGNLLWAECLSCGQRYPFDQMVVRLGQGEEIPDCESCHGILKPAAVFFGEALPTDVLMEATRRAQSSDLCIVIGSTLVVYPAAYMPQYAVSNGAKLVIINLSSTPMDGDADVLIRAKAGDAMARIMELVREAR